MDPIKVDGPPARPDPAGPARPLPSAIFPDPDRGDGCGPAGWRRVTLYTAALAAMPEADRPDGARLRFIALGVMAWLEVEPRWLVADVLALPQSTPLEARSRELRRRLDERRAVTSSGFSWIDIRSGPGDGGLRRGIFRLGGTS